MSKKASYILLLISAVFFYLSNNLLHGLSLPVGGTIKYRVINTFNHPDAFTEGLIFDDGLLYESSGLYKYSRLTKYKMISGERLTNYNLPYAYFAEGITLLNNEIYQLTYKERTVFVYNKDTLQLKRQLTYFDDGWGLTNDGTWLIQSDGSSKLHYLNPANMSVVKEIDVQDNHHQVMGLNSLEYVNGKIYANIFPTSFIAEIDANDGKVTGWIDVRKLDPYTNINNQSYITNGIAYNKVNQTFYITGKHWPHLYEIKLEA